MSILANSHDAAKLSNFRKPTMRVEQRAAATRTRTFAPSLKGGSNGN